MTTDVFLGWLGKWYWSILSRNTVDVVIFSLKDKTQKQKMKHFEVCWEWGNNRDSGERCQLCHMEGSGLRIIRHWVTFEAMPQESLPRIISTALTRSLKIFLTSFPTMSWTYLFFQPPWDSLLFLIHICELLLAVGLCTSVLPAGSLFPQLAALVPPFTKRSPF